MDNIEDIIKNVIGNIANQKGDHVALIEDLWNKILSEDELKHCKISGVKDKKITVLVDSPAWMFQLKTKKKKILEEINNSTPDIETIFFRIGKI